MSDANQEGKRCLLAMGASRALGFVSPREEMQEIVETVDPNDLGYVLYDQFLNVAALKMRGTLDELVYSIELMWRVDRDTQEEVEKAFQLFTSGKEGPIKLEDLRRIADKLKEELTDDQLRDMLSEASDNPGRGVNMSVSLPQSQKASLRLNRREFEGVMKRAGVL